MKLSTLPAEADLTSTVKQRSLKSLDKRYKQRKEFDVLAVVESWMMPKGKKGGAVARAERAIDNMFFTVEKVDKPESTSKEQVSMVTGEGRGGELVSKLQFEEKMRLVFDDKDSLALKSLQDGVVDFSDSRIAIKGANVME